MAERLRLPRRVFIEDLRRDGTYLRVTWHPESRAFVVSHWKDRLCTAATRIAVEDSPQLVALLAEGLGEAAEVRPAGTSRRARSRRVLGRILDVLPTRRRHRATIRPLEPVPRPSSVFDEPVWRSGAR